MKKILIAACFFFWPLTIFLTLRSESIEYLIGIFICSILFTICTLYKKSYASVFLIPLGLLSPKLVLIPILYILIQLIAHRKGLLLIPFLISLLIGIVFLRDYYNQSIFTFDYQAQQLVERETKLYSSVFMSRLFHNKARIKTDKFVSNAIALTDPNNYFFGFHPRQIVRENLNIKKFPIAIMPFVLWFVIKKKTFIKQEVDILIFTITALFTLGTLANFDRSDIVLFGPLCALAVASVVLAKGVIVKLLPLFTMFCIWEILYLFSMLFS